MQRAQQIIRHYARHQAALMESCLFEATPKLSTIGSDAIKEVDTFAKDQLRKLNPVLKWKWAGRHPTERQRRNDFLQWSFTVNSFSHGKAVVADARRWFSTVLEPAVQEAFADSPLDVVVSMRAESFGTDESDPEAGIHFANVYLRLNGLLEGGLVEPAAGEVATA